jgi:hypothetical protein
MPDLLLLSEAEHASALAAYFDRRAEELTLLTRVGRVT